MKYQEAIDALEARGQWTAVKILEELRASKPKPKRGPVRSRSMSDEVRERIVQLHHEGMINSEIAATLNINQGRVSETLNGQ
jgi:DNA-binding NarL/FixJ family response regulator